jgi:hypothetical protein
MIVGADAGFQDTYPKGADPDTKSPYVIADGSRGFTLRPDIKAR